MYMSNHSKKKQKRNILKLIILVLMIVSFVFAIINLYTNNYVRDHCIKNEEYHDYDVR